MIVFKEKEEWLLELLCSLDSVWPSVCSVLWEEESKADCSFSLPLFRDLQLWNQPPTTHYSKGIEGPPA